VSAAKHPLKKQRYNKGWANLIPCKPGQSGNPNGRPPGSRQLIASAFLTDALEDWQESGKQSFRELAKANPHEYLRLIAEVGHLVGKQHAYGEHEPVDDHRPVLALGDLLAYITHGGSPPPVPDRPVRTFDSSPQPAGCDAPVDSRPLPGDPE
jgi:hypothetical protein